MNSILCALVLLLTSSAYVFAGIDGGGGGAYVCRNYNGEIEKSFLVDLWESENTPFKWPNLNTTKISIEYNNHESVNEQIEKGLYRLNNFDTELAKMVKNEIYPIKDNLMYLPDNISITTPSDLLANYYPTGCKPEGMMFYENSFHQLYVNKNIFNKFQTNTDVAAAFMHEAIYKVFRESKYNHKDSKATRRLVACLFSSECSSSVSNKFPSDRVVYSCNSDYLDVFVFPVKATFNSTPELNQKWRIKYKRIDNIQFKFNVFNDFVLRSNSGPIGTTDLYSFIYSDTEGWFDTFNYQPAYLGMKVMFKNRKVPELDVSGNGISYSNLNVNRRFFPQFENKTIYCNRVQ